MLLRRKVARLERIYHQAVRDLDKINSDIVQLEKALKDLSSDYETAVTDRQRLQAEAELMERRLIAADKLISGLGSEKARYFSPPIYMIFACFICKSVCNVSFLAPGYIFQKCRSCAYINVMTVKKTKNTGCPPLIKRHSCC